MASTAGLLPGGGVPRRDGVVFSDDWAGVVVEFDRDLGCWRDRREFARDRG